MLRKVAIILFSLLIVILPASFVVKVNAQRQYHLEREWVKIWINQNGTIDLFYNISITLDSGPNINYVLIGQPKRDFTIGSAKDQYGHILTAADASSGSDYKVRVNLYTPLMAGQTVWFTLITNVAHMIWEDPQNPGNVGMQFIPTWWSEASVMDLRVLIVLPVGVTEDMVRTSVNWDNKSYEDDRLAIYWEKHNLLPNEQYPIDVSFPKDYVQYFGMQPRVHNIDTGLNYTSIQEAINNANEGDTIYVDNGTYYENVVVNRAVSLIGENSSTTIVDGNMTGDVVRITKDHVNITGFTIQRGGRTLFNSGISISSTRHCDISGNRIVENEVGIYGSPKNTSISNNTITNNHVGVAIDPRATCNIISRNRLMANNVSIHIYNANSNNIFENNITNNWRSITLGYSRNNRFHHNYFFNNTEQILIFPSGYANFWDNGLEGNYWDNYTSVDSNHDGIGDTEHVIDENNTDRYPLMGVFHSFNTSLGHHVNVISNSTIENFEYFESNSTIKMYVSGEDGFGFCRVSIPYEDLVMNVSNIFIIIDDGLTPVLYSNYTLYDNGTHRWIYFAFQHSMHEIDIVPAFPSFLILPLFMTATLLVITTYKRKISVSKQAQNL